MEIGKLTARQRKYFETGQTLPLGYRMHALERLEEIIRNMEPEINRALKQDLNKSGFESYMTEVGLTLSELSYVKRHLPLWMAKKTVLTPVSQLPACSYRVSEPYGVVLVISPWNYPFMLSMEPLIGALAAGNCCIIKPSNYAPHVSAVIRDMIARVFPKQYVAVVEGGRKENAMLLEQKFDYIFFTGGAAVGKLVMEKAAKRLIPVTLELGGKSPCIVEESADLKMAAKRLVFGKFINAGQTCVAPDYLLVQESVKETFISHMKYWIKRMYGETPEMNEQYPKIINAKHFKRLCSLIMGEEILTGGTWREETLQIAPTLLDHVSPEAPVMQEEIFGPVLPILTFGQIKEAEDFVKSRPKPLALYLFTRSREVEKRVVRNVSYGGGCINDTMLHLATSRMGFGGVGASGMGSYHGKESFLTFSHRKSIVKRSNFLDLPVRYLPYTQKKEKQLRIFLK